MLGQKTTREPARKKQWWCANCLAPIELNIHGRCGACGSDAVDKAGLKGSARAQGPLPHAAEAAAVIVAEHELR